VCIPDHHQGFLDWDDYLANQQRIGENTRPTAHQPGTGAVRDGCALLQGLASCGTCGRKLAVYYDGRHRNTPGYYCTGTGHLIDGKNLRHLRSAASPSTPPPAWPPPGNCRTATTTSWNRTAVKGGFQRSSQRCGCWWVLKW